MPFGACPGEGGEDGEGQSYAFRPIGVVRSPFRERASAPRQASVAGGVSAAIELFPGRGYEHALEGLDAWQYAWVVFVFHLNIVEGRGWRPKVLPPRSRSRRGVFATRSPHRPNPIGLSAVAIDAVDGLTVRVRNMDLLDGTPVLDLKPYVAYADAYAGAGGGWLGAADPVPPWTVEFSACAGAQLEWLRERGVDLRSAIEAVLQLGPQPHPYRRIRPNGDGMRLAVKDWRADFQVGGQVDGQVDEPRRILVRSLCSGYRPRELALDPELAVHLEFSQVWPRM